MRVFQHPPYFFLLSVKKMAQTDRKARAVMGATTILLAITTVISLMANGFALTSLLLIGFTLLAFFLTITTPKQLQDFMDTLLD